LYLPVMRAGIAQSV